MTDLLIEVLALESFALTHVDIFGNPICDICVPKNTVLVPTSNRLIDNEVHYVFDVTSLLEDTCETLYILVKTSYLTSLRDGGKVRLVTIQGDLMNDAHTDHLPELEEVPQDAEPLEDKKTAESASSEVQSDLENALMSVAIGMIWDLGNGNMIDLSEVVFMKATERDDKTSEVYLLFKSGANETIIADTTQRDLFASWHVAKESSISADILAKNPGWAGDIP